MLRVARTIRRAQKRQFSDLVYAGTTINTPRGMPDYRHRAPGVPLPTAPLPEDYDLLWFDPCHPMPLLDAPEGPLTLRECLFQACVAFGTLFGIYWGLRWASANRVITHNENPAAHSSMSVYHNVLIGSIMRPIEVGRGFQYASYYPRDETQLDPFQTNTENTITEEES